MSIIEKEGKTVEQAIEKGLKEMGLSRDEVQVEIVSLGSSGFLGIFGARPAKVRLKVQVQPRVKKIVETILARMGFPGSVRSFSEEGGRLTAVIESEEGEKYLRANNGAALDALEYLLGKICHHTEQDIHLDIGGFRQSQGDNLRAMALDLAKKVKETGQEQKLQPMPPHQRKVVHKALENYPDIKTFAVGEGDRRRVIIAPRFSDRARNSGQTPRHGSGQTSKQSAGQPPRPPSGETSRPAGQKSKPQAEARPKTSGKQGRRESSRKPQGEKPSRSQESQEQSAKQTSKTAPVEIKMGTGYQEAGFVPRSRKKSRRP